MKKNIFITLLTVSLLLLTSNNSYAIKFGIAAKVNDDIITTKDLKDRFGFVIVTSQMKYNSKNRSTIMGQILQRMIDEKLQQQEANRLGVTIDSKTVNNEIAKIESSQGIPKGSLQQMLRREDVPYQTYYEQVYTQILWSKLVVTSLGSTIQVTNAEVEEYLEEVAKKSKVNKFLLSEIYVPVNKDDKQDTKQIAEDIALQINGNSKKFDKIARNFSKNDLVTVDKGEKWIYDNELDKNVLKAVNKLAVGGIAEPIMVKKGNNQGYYIFRLDDKKEDLNTSDQELKDIKNKLFYVKLEAAARDYMLNLRRNAYIEIEDISKL